MFSRIFTTSWQHISRTRLASVSIVVVLTGLFFTFFIGFFLIQQAEYQRQLVVKKFNYPIFISNQYTSGDQKVMDFMATLRKTVARPGEIQYIPKEKVLDMQIQKDPSILKVLGGVNPLNDIIMVPLYGTDIDALLPVVQQNSAMFEAVQPIEDVQKSLIDFESTLREIKRLTNMTGIFLTFIWLLMAVLMIVVIRIHIRIFQDERDVCELVGASPFFYWSPHIVSVLFYVWVSLFVSFAIFLLFQSIFGT